MRNVQMIRTEPGFVSIPLEKAVYCKNCETVSTSAGRRCGVCGSERFVVLAHIVSGPPDPGSPPPASVAIALRVAA